MSALVETEDVGQLRYLTLNRADKRNALSGALVDELKAAFRNAADDEHVRVVILRAKGTVFSAGADLDYLRQLMQNSFEENFADSSSLAELFHLIYTHPKIVITQVEGSAIAGGCGLATVADFCFAVPEAQFGYTEVKIGFIPAIVSIFLLRKIGEGKAKDLLFTGKIIPASAAQAIGLINEVVPAAEIAVRVKTFAGSLCSETSAQSVALTRKLLNEVHELPMSDALQLAARMNAEARATDDCRRGVTAFLNKEKIRW